MLTKKVRNLVLINCLLLTLPNFAFATEPTQQDLPEYVLDEVVVSAFPLEKYLVTTSVITDKDIAEKGAKNLSEALEDVPGLHVHRGKKSNNSLDIRGIGVSYTKIYIDGILVNPLAKAAGADVDLDMFPVENVAKIEVIKGPAPVAYGTDAIGGIILITTKNGKMYDGGQVSLSGGSDATRNVNLSYGGGNSEFNYYFNAGSEHTDGHTDNDFRKSNYINTKLNWKVKDNAVLTFAGSYSETDKGCQNPIDPATGEPLFYRMGFWRGMNNWQTRDWQQTNLSLTYAEKASEKFDYNVKVYRFSEKNSLWADGANHYAGINPNGYSLLRWNASYWDSDLYGVEFQGNLKIDTKNTLTFGTLYNDNDWQKNNTNANNSDPYTNVIWQKYNNKRQGYYVQDNLLLNEKTTLTFGLRHDKNEVVDHQTSNNKAESDTNPTFNMVYRLDGRNTLRASYGETISFPTVSQLYGNNGYANLKPEKAKNYEIGWKHRFDDSVTGDIAIFKNDITDMIETTLDPNSSTGRRYANVSEAEIKGIELEVNKQFNKRTKGFLNYTFLDTNGTMVMYDYSTRTNDVKNTPNHNIKYGITYQADKGYTFRLTGHVISSRATYDEATFNGGNPTDTRAGNMHYNRIGGYHVMDLQIKREMDKDRDWYINIYNIFDRDYQEELFYPAAGRTVIAGVDFKF